ncbi:Gfo/Idh/MocA family protein [Paenibacillus allorhizosphaerae]|uniref:Oxidoreductase YteT n=1 Tax=Paenibacillus allorhizosphaerae TaxID=2849866 RepID=A0ABM8VLJ8_9BACL|nr:Gfo/Idh/MocA family oxidoreductase [Paenibacillus allorhizosphaerae]CAG7648661.1 Putative oxidoreductase YteT [Paenibacillus allorhizosphaerae]
MEQVRIGVIGLGWRAGVTTKYWHQPEGRSIVVAGADIDPSRLEKFRSKINPDADVTLDYRELLERQDIDAIVVMSPDRCHEEHAVAALQAGKHVYCEKPLAISVEGCDRILEAWARSGKKLMMGFNMRYMNMYRTMKEIIDSGEIGEVKAIWVRHFVGLGSDYYYHSWHGSSRNTTSLLLQKGSHDFDIIHWLAGRYTRKVSAFGGVDYFGGNQPNDLTCPECAEKDRCPEARFGPLMQCAFREEIDVEDNSTLIMELEGGVKASYMQCHFTPDYQRNYTIIGTEGRIENSEPENRVYVKSRRSGTWRDMSDRIYEIKTAQGSHNGADPKICDDFIDMIVHGKEPIASPGDGRMSVAVGCAAAESMRSGGQVMTIKPLQESVAAQSF